MKVNSELKKEIFDILKEEITSEESEQVDKILNEYSEILNHVLTVFNNVENSETEIAKLKLAMLNLLGDKDG